jgi:hypothetical protein
LPSPPTKACPTIELPTVLSPTFTSEPLALSRRPGIWAIPVTSSGYAIPASTVKTTTARSAAKC